jgi:hypothetical protein
LAGVHFGSRDYTSVIHLETDYIARRSGDQQHAIFEKNPFEFLIHPLLSACGGKLTASRWHRSRLEKIVAIR